MQRPGSWRWRATPTSIHDPMVDTEARSVDWNRVAGATDDSGFKGSSIREDQTRRITQRSSALSALVSGRVGEEGLAGKETLRQGRGRSECKARGWA